MKIFTTTHYIFLCSLSACDGFSSACLSDIAAAAWKGSWAIPLYLILAWQEPAATTGRRWQSLVISTRTEHFSGSGIQRDVFKLKLLFLMAQLYKHFSTKATVLGKSYFSGLFCKGTLEIITSIKQLKYCSGGEF